MMKEHFGEHITIDGYDGDPVLLSDPEVVLRTLSQLCEEQEMTPLGEPTIVWAPENDIKDPGGWSAYLMIMESHISIHTFPRRRFISADFYTCKNGLDKKEIIDRIQENFNLGEVESHFIKRGCNYPEQNVCELDPPPPSVRRGREAAPRKK